MRARARFVISNTSQRLTASASAHDALQREALEGELTALERAWAEAEGIATIADALLLPDAVTEQFDRLKKP